MPYPTHANKNDTLLKENDQDADNSLTSFESSEAPSSSDNVPAEEPLRHSNGFTYHPQTNRRSDEQKKENIGQKPKNAPTLCISTALSQKSSPRYASSWMSLSLTLDGRDKITKVFQYSSRLVAYILEYHLFLFKDQAQRFRNLQSSLTQSRKAFRLGRSFLELFRLWKFWLGLFHRNRTNSDENEDKIASNRERNMGNADKYQTASLMRKASSNVAWGPPQTPIATNLNTTTEASHAASSHWLKRMYTRLTSYYDSPYPPSTVVVEPRKEKAWKIICTSLKLIGLAGFWAGDNMSFLISSGFLYLDGDIKKKKKTDWQHFAARCYFFGALVGLYASGRELISHRDELRQKWAEERKDEGQEHEETMSLQLQGVMSKHFELVLALLKSCCDVMVFSNNPGVDLHEKHRGKKMNEGFHCVCGLLSASTVLYKNFPNK